MPDWPDAVNAAFEFGAAAAVLNHCRVLWLAKRFEGVSAISTAFFVSWGFWNVYFYGSLAQPASRALGVLVILANALWLGLMIRYRGRG